MTMAYFSSFDTAQIGASTLTLSTSGKSNISIDLAFFAWPNQFGTNVSVFNHVVASDWTGMGPFQEYPLYSMPSDSFCDAVETMLRSLATTATWTNPNSINVLLNTTTWLCSFTYSNSLTAITFGNTETRRLFGFSGNFSGSATSVTGTEVPKYIIVPTVNGASSTTPVFEQESISSFAYSGAGRPYALSRSTNQRMRTWVQQYETKARTFRRSAAAAPNEFTFQHLFENCRARYPFGVYGGFGSNNYEAYILRAGSESFHPYPASPGNSNQFHIPFEAYAMARS